MSDQEWAKRMAGEFGKQQEEAGSVTRAKSLQEQQAQAVGSQLWEEVKKAFDKKMREFNRAKGSEVLAWDPGFKGGWSQFRVVRSDNHALMSGRYDLANQVVFDDKYVYTPLIESGGIVRALNFEGTVLTPEEVAGERLRELLERPSSKAKD